MLSLAERPPFAALEPVVPFDVGALGTAEGAIFAVVSELRLWLYESQENCDVNN